MWWGELAQRGEHFEYTLQIQHKVRLYFSLTQFLILKSQACTSHLQAAQICALEVLDRRRLQGRQHIGQSSLQKAGQNRPRLSSWPLCGDTQSNRTAEQNVLSTDSTGAVNSEQEENTGLRMEGKAGFGLAGRQLVRHSRGHTGGKRHSIRTDVMCVKDFWLTGAVVS